MNRKVRVLVLGDMARSPRMTNHCLSFAKTGWQVYFSGYLTSNLTSYVTSNENIHVDLIKSPCDFFDKRKKLKFFLILKVLLTAFYLLCHLLWCEWTPILLIQNPPAVPTFIVAWIMSKIRRTKLIIDWHNYGHTLMNAESDQRGSLARLYKHIELKFSKHLKAYNFCVSKALKIDLLLKWDIASTVLYDRPWSVNCNNDLKIVHELFMRLSKKFPAFVDPTDDTKTAFTELLSDNQCQYRENRPVIIASSCSWTIDDDFETLFKSLDAYNTRVNNGEYLPEVICIITGKGPMKGYFERLVNDQQWAHVKVVMPWLDIEDYPVLLGAADLGICLHKSTSGLDLPMKVVDMFAVGLPVLALNYKCLHELVIDRINGRLFSTDDGLLKHLVDLLGACRSDLDSYRVNLASNVKHGLWQEHWEEVVLPVAESLLPEARRCGTKRE